MAEPTRAPDHKRAAPSHAAARVAETHQPPAPELQPDAPGGDVTARHASLLADRRLSGERVRLLQRLQHGYGNGHVARVVQRVVDAPAPPATHLEPDQDPKFQQVQGKIKQAGAKQKQHASPKAKAAEAQAAAHGPSNDVKSKAAAKQVGAMDAQQPGAFDRAAFIAAVKKSIDAKTPKNLEEADDFKESGKAGEVKGEVTGLVGKGKQDAERGIKDKTQAAPDTSGVQPKPVAPMGEEKAGPQPPDVGAKQAVPDRKSPAETSLDQGPAQVNDQMAQADVTEDQLQHSNEPTFQTALGQKKQAEEHSQTAPPQFKAQEQQILTQASSQAAAEAQQQAAGMHRTRAAAQSHVGSHKDAAKARDEAKRAEVASKMEAIYSSTKTEVQATLDGLEGKVNAAFDKGEKAARDAFENHVDTRMRAYKKERYDGIRGKARWGWDKLTGMPSEVNAFYVEGRNLYIDKMEKVIGEVADIVGKELTAAKARIARGRHDLDEYTASLPRDLQQVGQAAQKEIAGKFDQLESDVNEKQDSLVQSLAEKYCAARDAVDDRIKEMQAANKGLVDAVIDAVGGVIRTILQLKDMLLGVLRKAADVIGTIIKDPIGFLGNLVGAVKQGLNQFVSNIGTHLEQGLMGWLFGAVGQAGIKLPDSFDLKGILSLVLQVLGLTYDNIRGIAVTLVGEKVVSGIEGTVKVLMTLAKEGPAGLWEWIKDKVAEIDIQGMVLGAIKDFVITRIITAGVTWLIGLLNPAAGFIKACKAIYDIIMFFIERGSQIMEFVNSVLDSIGAIATGNIGAAANLVENSLAKILPLAISFLASLLGLDGIGEKIKQIIEKIRAPITKLVTAVLTPILKPFKKIFDKGANFVKGVVAKGKALGNKALDKAKTFGKASLAKVSGMFGKGKDKPADTAGKSQPVPNAPQVDVALGKATSLLEDPRTSAEQVRSKLPGLQSTYHLTELALVEESATDRVASYHIIARKVGKSVQKGKAGKYVTAGLSSDGKQKLKDEYAKEIREWFFKKNFRSAHVADVLKKTNTRKASNGSTQYECADCGKWFRRSQITLDHHRPVAGYWNTWGHNVDQQTRYEWYDKPENLVVMCRPCNSSKGSGGVEYDPWVGPKFIGYGGVR